MSTAELHERAIASWRLSPVTALIVSWLMPDVAALMWRLDNEDLDRKGW